MIVVLLVLCPFRGNSEPISTTAASAMLYGPAKDLGEMLIDKYFDRRTEIMQREADKQALEDCDKMYVKFWDRVEAKTMDEETTNRYVDFFEKHCVALWER
jgi:hypothetical protein